MPGPQIPLGSEAKAGILDRLLSSFLAFSMYNFRDKLTFAFPWPAGNQENRSQDLENCMIAQITDSICFFVPQTHHNFGAHAVSQHPRARMLAAMSVQE